MPVINNFGKKCLVLVGALLFSSLQATQVPDILNMTIREMRQKMNARTLTSREVVEAYLLRIAEYDQEGPKLNAIRMLNMDLLNQADALDREQAAGIVRGPLHGIPVLIKDNIDAVGFPTTAGSNALANNYPGEDATLVANLRATGALIMGKSNLTEWANFISNRMVNGYSAKGGYVLNPYGPGKLDVSGSSSGSAAAVAAGLVPVAIGTETSGSIISPSEANSIFGLKPTIGLISRTGIIPIAPSQDTAGPMAKNVNDLAVMMNVLVGVDPKDPATLTAGMNKRDYTTYLKKDAMKGVKLGVAVQAVARLDEERKAHFAKILDELRSLGAVLVDVEMPGYMEMFEYSSRVLWYEFEPALNAYLQKTSPHVPVKSLGDVIAYNAAHAREQLRLGQAIMEAASRYSGSLTEKEYIQHRLRDRRTTRTDGIDHALKAYDIAALVFPSNSAAVIGARAGYPTLNVPTGYLADGQPFGMTFAGTALTEGTLIGLAYAFEQGFSHRVWPNLELIDK